jgi:hypothetical protein
VAAVFTNAAQAKDADRPEAQKPCAPEDVERLKREIGEAVRFYWVNSGMRLALHVDFLFDDRFVATPDKNAYGVGYTPKDEDRLKELLQKAGKAVADYDGRLFITFEKAWNEHEKKWVYPWSGGGTYGAKWSPGIGKSAWRGGCDNGWLFCHEFGHQLDSLCNYSMGPEYLGNHFQPWDNTAHRHGEHWDGNAWLLWWWARYVTDSHQSRPFLPAAQWFRYFILRWGEVVQTADVDEDGIPDDEPSVPLDEKRFGSSPQRMDTDGDGLTDLMEVMACNWVEHGLGETWAGDARLHRCDPTNPDTDGDGLRDGEDPYPLYPIHPTLSKGPVRAFARLKDQEADATLHLGWNDQALVIRVSARQKPDRIKLMLDANDDGWYVGGDNYMFHVCPDGGLRFGPEWRVNAERTFAVGFHNCSIVGKWPFFDGSRVTANDVEFDQKAESTGYVCTIKVRRKPENEIRLQAGERMGILFALRPKREPSRPDRNEMLTVFEPHTFVSFHLSSR